MNSWLPPILSISLHNIEQFHETPYKGTFCQMNVIHLSKVSKGAKIRKWYKQVPHLTQDTNGKVTNSQLYTTNESQEVSPFPAGDHKAQINRRVQRHNKHKPDKNIKIRKRRTALERSVK